MTTATGKQFAQDSNFNRTKAGLIAPIIDHDKLAADLLAAQFKRRIKSLFEIVLKINLETEHCASFDMAGEYGNVFVEISVFKDGLKTGSHKMPHVWVMPYANKSVGKQVPGQKELQELTKLVSVVENFYKMAVCNGL